MLWWDIILEIVEARRTSPADAFAVNCPIPALVVVLHEGGAAAPHTRLLPRRSRRAYLDALDMRPRSRGRPALRTAGFNLKPRADPGEVRRYRAGRETDGKPGFPPERLETVAAGMAVGRTAAGKQLGRNPEIENHGAPLSRQNLIGTPESGLFPFPRETIVTVPVSFSGHFCIDGQAQPRASIATKRKSRIEARGVVLSGSCP